MNLIEWYLNLTFWQAVLVWLKLLLPVLLWKAMKLVHGMSESHNEPINVVMVHKAKQTLVQYGD